MKSRLADELPDIGRNSCPSLTSFFDGGRNQVFIMISLLFSHHYCIHFNHPGPGFMMFVASPDQVLISGHLSRLNLTRFSAASKISNYPCKICSNMNQLIAFIYQSNPRTIPLWIFNWNGKKEDQHQNLMVLFFVLHNIIGWLTYLWRHTKLMIEYLPELVAVVI